MEPMRIRLTDFRLLRFTLEGLNVRVLGTHDYRGLDRQNRVLGYSNLIGES